LRNALQTADRKEKESNREHRGRSTEGAENKNAGWKPAAQNKKAPNRVGAQFVTVSNVAQEEIIVKEKKVWSGKYLNPKELQRRWRESAAMLKFPQARKIVVNLDYSRS